MDSLKNCPFCGAEAVMETFTTAMEKKPRFRVRCTNCPCDLGWEHWSVEGVRDAWNKREPPDEPSVPAVPLDKLCEWLERNAAGRWNGLEYTASGWKDELTRWMEEQDAAD